MIQNIYISENLYEQTAFPCFYECGMAYCSYIVYGIQSKLEGFKERKTIRSGVLTDHFPPVTQNLSHSKMLNRLRLLAALNVGDKRFFQDNIQSPF